MTFALSRPFGLIGGIAGSVASAVNPGKIRDAIAKRRHRFREFVGTIEVGQDWTNPFGLRCRVEFIGPKGATLRYSECVAGRTGVVFVTYLDLYRDWLNMNPPLES